MKRDLDQYLSFCRLILKRDFLKIEINQWYISFVLLAVATESDLTHTLFLKIDTSRQKRHRFAIFVIKL